MRLIDADVLIEFIENRYKITWKDDYEGGIKDACTDILEKISKMPTIDAVEVVRCQDCKYRDTETGFCEGRGWPMQLVPDDGFCDKGKRRE